MAANEPLLPCPFCQGHGQLSRQEIVSRLEDPELPEKIVAELNRSEESREPVTAGPAREKAPKAGEFSSSVHGWNKHVLWRRSSKE
ncbi:MAG TPA: hypothetical protein VJ756_00915 [Terriglobales bacterium]|jgi:hypothetical protein|nr:hypothetical protein [Terriglobales bacterium]